MVTYNAGNGDCVAGGGIAPLCHASSCDQPIAGCHTPVRYRTPNNGCQAGVGVVNLLVPPSPIGCFGFYPGTSVKWLF